MSEYIQQNQSVMSFDGDESWVIMSSLELSIKRKIEAVGVPLKEWDIKIYRGVLTGFNEAFIISGQKKDELIAADPKSAEIIRPILRGRDVKRYGYTFSDLWLIATHNGIKGKQIPRVDINEYPAIKAHLDKYYEKLKDRTDKGDTPYNLRNCVYMDDLNKQKIMWGEISDTPKFALDLNGEYFVEATTFMMTGESLWFILSILNSSLSQFFFSKLGTTTGVGTLRWKKYKLEEFSIPLINTVSDKYISTLEELSKNPIKNYSQIDSVIFKIYGLSHEEIVSICNQ